MRVRAGQINLSRISSKFYLFDYQHLTFNKPVKRPTPHTFYLNIPFIVTNLKCFHQTLYAMDRRLLIKTLAATGISLSSYEVLLNLLISDYMQTKKIPSTNEALPIIGLGTWQTFDVGRDPESRKQLLQVLETLIDKNGNVIDSSPMYGSSEKVVGDLTQQTSSPNHFFYATKVWISGEQQGISQMNHSFKQMQRKQMDLMQIHNLLDWKTHLRTLTKWKEEGKVRYIGITHYTASALSEMIQIIQKEDIDFIQINYSMNFREAEDRLFPVAQDKGVAVLINRPYEGGLLFRKVREHKIPDWAREMDINSWGQFFLKFIISHPAVTCAIPGTSKPHHALDNMLAGYGHIPNQAERSKMLDHFQEIN